MRSGALFFRRPTVVPFSSQWAEGISFSMNRERSQEASKTTEPYTWQSHTPAHQRKGTKLGEEKTRAQGVDGYEILRQKRRIGP